MAYEVIILCGTVAFVGWVVSGGAEHPDADDRTEDFIPVLASHILPSVGLPFIGPLQGGAVANLFITEPTTGDAFLVEGIVTAIGDAKVDFTAHEVVISYGNPPTVPFVLRAVPKACLLRATVIK